MSSPSSPVRPSFNALFGISSSPGSEPFYPPTLSSSGQPAKRPAAGGGAREPLSSPAGSVASSPMTFKVVDLPPSTDLAAKRAHPPSPSPKRRMTANATLPPASATPGPATSSTSGRSNRTQAPFAFTVSTTTKSADFPFVCTSCEPEPRFFASNGARKVHQRITHMQICIVHLPKSKAYEVSRVHGVFACPLCQRTNLSTDFLKQHTSRSINCNVEQLAALPSLPANWSLLPGGVVLGRKPPRKAKPVLAPIRTAKQEPVAPPAPDEVYSGRRTRSGRPVKAPTRFGGARSQRSSSILSSLAAATSEPSPPPVETPVSPPAASASRRKTTGATSTADTPSVDAVFTSHCPSVAEALDAQEWQDELPARDRPWRSRRRKVAPPASTPEPSRPRKRPVNRTVTTMLPAKKVKGRPSIESEQAKAKTSDEPLVVGPVASYRAGAMDGVEPYQMVAYPPAPTSAFGNELPSAAPTAAVPTWPVYPPPRRAQAPWQSEAHQTPVPTLGQPARNLSVPPPQAYRPLATPTAARRVSASFVPAVWSAPTSSCYPEAAAFAGYELADHHGRTPFAPPAAFGSGPPDWSLGLPMPRPWFGQDDEWLDPTAGHHWHTGGFAP